MTFKITRRHVLEALNTIGPANAAKVYRYLENQFYFEQVQFAKCYNVLDSLCHSGLAQRKWLGPKECLFSITEEGEAIIGPNPTISVRRKEIYRTLAALIYSAIFVLIAIGFYLYFK